MPKLVWDQTGERMYETGVDRGVVYPISNGEYGAGAAWSGLTAVSMSPSGAESNPIYADNMKYLDLYSPEEFGYSIEAYTYPDEFAECDGSAEPADGVILEQQPRKPFGFSCRTLIGNDVDKNDYGYYIHLIYNSMAAPSEKGYSTTSDSPEAITMSWECTTTPVNVTGYKPTAHLKIKATKSNAAKVKELEDILYGSETGTAKLPLPDEVIQMFKTV